MNKDNFLNEAVKWLTNAGIKLVIAAVILIVTFKLINLLYERMIRNTKAKMDKTWYTATCRTVKIVLKVLIALSLVSYLGIDIAGLTALLTTIGVGITLAVNGTLSNVAGGVTLLFTRAFKLDDYIEISGYEGTVEEIGIINTRIRSYDNRTIYIPNATVISNTVVNYTASGKRRVDLTFSVAYDVDFAKARSIIYEVLNSLPKVMKEPKADVRMLSHDASCITICCRPWVLPEDYWSVYFDVTELVKERFDKNGIEIPYQQLDIHMR